MARHCGMTANAPTAHRHAGRVQRRWDFRGPGVWQPVLTAHRIEAEDQWLALMRDYIPDECLLAWACVELCQ